MATKKQILFAKSGIKKVQELEETLKEFAPDAAAEIADAPFDVERAFQLYAQFSGDIERTAHVLNVAPVEVLRAADRLGWAKKLEAIFELKKSGKPGEVERGLSRAMAFVQAHRYRVLVERVLTKLYDMSDEELYEMCFSVKTTTKKDGTVEETRMLNTKPFSDLAAAMEKVHQMCYAALGDTVTERAARKDQVRDDDVSASQLHAIIASAMAGGDTTSPAAQLLEKQIAEKHQPLPPAPE